MYFDINAHRDCFKTDPNKAYFWHGRTNGCGGPDTAMKIAEKSNGKTLEKCMLDNRAQLEQAGVIFEDKENGKVTIDYGGNFDEARHFWEDCSKAFAEQASGNVYVIAGTDLRPNGQSETDFPSIYNRIEHPTLEQNQNVNSITHIDPETRLPTKVEVFSRPQSSSADTGTVQLADTETKNRDATLVDFGLGEGPQTNTSIGSSQAVNGGMM